MLDPEEDAIVDAALGRQANAAEEDPDLEFGEDVLDDDVFYPVLDCEDLHSVGNPDIQGTFAFYKSHLDDEVYKGARCTLRQYCYEQLLARYEDSLSQKALANRLTFDHDTGPEPNYVPPTVYMWSRLVGVGDISHFERHVCPCEFHVYDHAHPDQWHALGDDTCPHCNETRFYKKRNGRLAPRKVCFRPILSDLN